MSDSTPPPDSVPLLVGNSRSQMVVLAGCFVSYLPLIPLPAGNSVHADKRFLEKYMPQFMYHLHYRIIDVSTVKELCRPVFLSSLKGILPAGRPPFIYKALITTGCLKFHIIVAFKYSAIVQILFCIYFSNSNTCRRWFPEEYKRVPHKKATHR